MDEVWLEVLEYSEENSTEENSSMEEKCAEENSSMEEKCTEENSSMEEKCAEENSSMEEKCAEENSSMEEKCAEENSSMEEKCAEENSSMEEFWEEKINSSEESWLKSHGLLEYFFIKEHGLIFEKTTVDTEVCTVEIVAVGNCDSGKTQLIKDAFGDHPSFNVNNHDGRDEYHIYLSKNMFFHILISDVKDVEYVRKENFRYKTVFFFCYDANNLETLVNLEDTWIPIIFRNYTKRMSYFLVGIEHAKKIASKCTNRINSQEKMAIEDKAMELCRQNHSIVHVVCSIEVKSSMLDAFQAAIDAVYPRTFLC